MSIQLDQKFVFKMNYQCVICLQLCKRPIACLQCQKLLCFHHLKRIGDKCPHCRLSPFQYLEKPEIQRLIQLERFKRKETMKKQSIFKCLVEGCNFEGKYHAMEKHRRSRHYGEKIDEILFPEDRENKVKKDAIKKVFSGLFEEQKKITAQQAIVLYAKNKGKCDFKKLIKMLGHVNNCRHGGCQKVHFGQDVTFIGDRDKHMTECVEGANLIDLL